MSSDIVARGVITDALLDYMVAELAELALPILVGDGEKPTGTADAPVIAGWVGGVPGQGEFNAFVTVATATATPVPGEKQRLSGQHGSWSLGYVFKHYGGSRTQTDWCADKIRNVVVGFDTRDLPEDFGWSVESVIYPSLGPAQRNDQITPPEWSLQDAAGIQITRDRG